jgi:N-acetyltransferase
MTDAARVDAVLEALGLEAQPPSARSFEELFLRFQRRLASETLTRPAGDARDFDPEAFFAEWVEEERGVVGDERARAFAWLAGKCGFEISLAGGICRRPWEDASERDEQRPVTGLDGAHRGVIAAIDGRRVLADAGFPLPVLLPLDPPAADIPTALGAISLKIAEKERLVVTCDGRGEESDLLRLDLAPGLSPPEYRRRHEATGAPGAFALRVLDDRVLYWRGGRMTILDAWSRLEYPLPPSKRSAIEKIFALELGEVTLRDAPPAVPPQPATLSVHHLSPAAPDEARGRVGRDAIPLILVSSRETRVEAVPGGSRVTIRATLADVPPEGPGEAVRKTLVFHLASELFELGKEDERGPGKTA